MKVILISIKPKWVAKILNGEKTIEIRKTMPKCDLPIDVYIYCTDEYGKALIYKNGKYEIKPICGKPSLTKVFEDKNGYETLNGKVVTKFTLNKVEEITNRYCKGMLLDSCLTNYELNNYLENCIGYAWHIDNLVIFDKPKELSEFRKINTPTYEQTKPFAEMFGNTYTKEEYIEQCKKFGYILTKAPQSWCYVEELE